MVWGFLIVAWLGCALRANFSEVLSAQAATVLTVEPKAKIRLIKQISLDSFGGIPFVADLNSDGQEEFLWLQTAGIFRSKVFDLPPNSGHFNTTADEKNLYCLTATDQSGKILWQVGKPWRGTRPFVTHGADRSVDVAAIDGDGHAEVVAAMGGIVGVIDGLTGAFKRTVQLDTDNVEIARVARTGRSPGEWTILAMNGDAAYPPHEYSSPTFFFDGSLRLLKKADFLGGGHAPQALDLDGDGIQEFLIGYNLVDSRLSTVWTFWPVPRAEWDPPEMHVDGLAIGQINNQSCIAYASGRYTSLVSTRDGKLIWKKPGVHPQQCQMGHFLPDSRDCQVLVANKRDGLQLFDAQGQEVWSIDPPPSFPEGRSPAAKDRFHMFDPTLLVRGIGSHGTDVFVYTDNGWPYMINGQGERFLDFPHTPDIAQDLGKVPGRADDYGYGFYARELRTVGTHGHGMMISDRRFAWIYEIVGAEQRPSGSVSKELTP